MLSAANLSPDSPPPAGARWVSAGQWQSLPLAVPEHGPLLADWFAEAAGAGTVPAAGRAPWSDPAWLSEVLDWIDGQGVTRTGPVTQIKSWSVSCLLKVPTAQGELYLKAMPAFFPTEAGVTAALAREFPDLLPRLVAADTDRRWLLMHAFAGPLLEDEPDLTRWEEALRSYAGLQVSMGTRVPDLLAAGCTDRRFPVMFAQFERLLADEPFLSRVLTAQETQALRERLPHLRDLARRLEGRGIPATLEHGDLHCRNVGLEPGAVRIFDWSDACVAHPFFSIKYFLDNRDDRMQVPEVNDRLLAAYLEPWAPFAGAESLRAAVDEAAELSYLHYALSYYWYIMPHSEDHWEAMVADYLRGLLK